LPIDRLPFHDVARLEQAHEITQIVDLLAGIVDRHRRDAEHLVAAGAAHRVDAAEASTVADRKLWRVRPRPQVFGGLNLSLALDHLVEEGETSDEADH